MKQPTPRAERDEGRGMTHHLPPAPRATACGVEHGWNDDYNVDNAETANQESTTEEPHHPPLLRAPAHRVDGGYCKETARRGANEGRRGGGMTIGMTQQTTHYLPPASQATARGVDHGWNEDNTSIEQQMTHHPPPALQATACGVDRGWNEDNDDNVKRWWGEGTTEDSREGER
jgi:hypothetical protein